MYLGRRSTLSVSRPVCEFVLLCASCILSFSPVLRGAPAAAPLPPAGRRAPAGAVSGGRPRRTSRRSGAAPQAGRECSVVGVSGGGGPSLSPASCDALTAVGERRRCTLRPRRRGMTVGAAPLAGFWTAASCKAKLASHSLYGKTACASATQALRMHPRQRKFVSGPRALPVAGQM